MKFVFIVTGSIFLQSYCVSDNVASNKDQNYLFFSCRIKQLIRRERGKLTKNSPIPATTPRPHFLTAAPTTARPPPFRSTPTPRPVPRPTPRPTSRRPPPSQRQPIDYEYDEDYYYYDEINGPGEMHADFNINSVDEDYGSTYYSDDGEEPEWHSFDQSEQSKPTQISKPQYNNNIAPVRNNPQKQPKTVVMTEDYYYYDEASEQDNRYQQQTSNKPPAVSTSPFQDYDYDYYDDHISQPVKRRDYNYYSDQLTAPPPPPNLSRRNGHSEQGRTTSSSYHPNQMSTNILKLPHAVVISNHANHHSHSRPNHSRQPSTPSRLSQAPASRPKNSRPPKPNKSRKKGLGAFSTSFLPGVASSTHMLYSLLPPPKNFRPPYLYSSKGKPPLTKYSGTQSVRPWWANASIVKSKPPARHSAVSSSYSPNKRLHEKQQPSSRKRSGELSLRSLKGNLPSSFVPKSGEEVVKARIPLKIPNSSTKNSRLLSNQGSVGGRQSAGSNRRVDFSYFKNPNRRPQRRGPSLLQRQKPMSSSSATLQTSSLLQLLGKDYSQSTLENLLRLSLQMKNGNGNNDVKKISRRQGFADLIYTTPKPFLQTIAGYPIQVSTLPPSLVASMSPPPKASSSKKGKGKEYTIRLYFMIA